MSFYNKENELTEEQSKRLDEIMFYNFITNLFIMMHNPIKVYDFVETVCVMGRLNSIILNSVVNTVLTDDIRFRPSRKEHAIILHLAGSPVRKTCETLQMSNTTYYKYIKKDIPIVPRHTEKQGAEITKFLDTLETLGRFTERRYDPWTSS